MMMTLSNDMFLPPPTTAAETRSIQAVGSYDVDHLPDAEREVELMAYRARKVRNMPFWRRAGWRPGLDVLDLGCGPGVCSMAMADEQDGGSVIGVDRSPLMLKHARQFATEQDTRNVTFLQGNVDNLPLLESSIDFTWSRYLFQHLPNPRAALREVRRVLRPGGTVCIVDIDHGYRRLTPHHPTIEACFEQLKDAQRQLDGDPEIGSKLGDLLEEAGLEDVEVETFERIDQGEAIKYYGALSISPEIREGVGERGDVLSGAGLMALS